MAHNYTQLAEELKRYLNLEQAYCKCEIEVEEGEHINIYPENRTRMVVGIHRFIDIAKFCDYHDLSVFVTEELKDRKNPALGYGPVVRIY